ncbi:MCE family protein [Aquihabitans sp. G128]|uniref:MCE family protein n=1 Tax=Aquihabitans sp. G128 TaxID=2849779 RepID=UPI001C237893|nr:MCE family protein [Aquihabitans sp. G128]QXC61954.1 MCE family protein [Aquihabitans sp. G128]
MKSFTERNPLIIGVIVLLLIGGGTAAALLLNGGFFKDRYEVKAVFVDTAGLRKGDKVRVAGVLVGQVKSIEQQGTKVQATLLVDKSIELPRDTEAEIVVETLLGSKYVRLKAGNDWSSTLHSGSVITDTRTPTEVLDLQNVGTPLLEDTDGKALNDLLDKIDHVTEGQRGNVGEIITGLNKLTTAINDRQSEARRLIDSTKTVSATLAGRDQDLLNAVDDINVVLDGLAKRRVQLVALLQKTSATAKGTADLVADNRPKLDAILDELHADLEIVGRRQGELAASLSGLTNAIEGFSSIGYSGPDRFPNTWANMYTQLLGPIGPDAVFGSCGLLDDAFDVLLGPDPVTECADRTGPLPSTEGATSASADGSAPAPTSDPLAALYAPLTEAAG